MNSIRYAGFWLRFAAFIIDSVVVSIVLIPLAAVVIGEVDLSRYDLQDPAASAALIQALSMRLSFDLVLSGVIVVLFWIFRSATPGKMLLRASIVDAADGGKPGSGRLIVRYLGYFVSLIPFGLGFVWIAFDSRKQGWHDKMARTVVVRDPKPSAQS